jgi:flagellum-specific ATP synthase
VSLDLLPLQRRLDRAAYVARPRRTGRISRIVGLNFEADGIDAAICDAVRVESAAGEILGEVVALSQGGLVCMPFGNLAGIKAGDAVEPAGRPPAIPVGNELLGRVLDGLGRPIDDGPSLHHLEHVSVEGEPPHPLQRQLVDQPLQLGVRALDTLVPCGRGQRLGIFAGSGVGKSSLLSMIARGTEADVSVIGLIGERGREVREFIENDLGPEGLARSVVVVATSDQPPLVRLRAAFVATRIAESFRDQGRDVVLMMDSLTRFCMAQREVGLSAGEPPASKGYPPSVFALLPKLLERAGAGDRGSITGLYTVLVEGDDMNEPVGDAARSILDGHIVLSRSLASAGHFPCIEVLDSLSRVAPAITNPSQKQAATELRRLMAAHRDVRDLVEIGAYVAGTNHLADRALDRMEMINGFLRQAMDEHTPSEAAWRQLGGITGVPINEFGRQPAPAALPAVIGTSA